MSIREQLIKTLEASRLLNMVGDTVINRVLNQLAELAESKADYILSENQKDLNRMDSTDPRYDRLKLTHERLMAIAGDIRNVAALQNPVGKLISSDIRPNGLIINKVSVPFGVVGIIYEARPNVTFDVFALCLKSGNACVLKGGSDAMFSNLAILSLIHSVLKSNQIDENTACLLTGDREETMEMMHAHGFIDLIIPRGGQGLINFVRTNSTIPVIETGAGICHTYFDETGDLQKGSEVIYNAKTRRPSVCNALDCLIIHKDRLSDLHGLTEKLAESKVLIYADSLSYSVLSGKYPTDLLQKATEESFGTEFLSLKMAVRTVENLEEAISHINHYGSKHSEAIISEDNDNIMKFRKMVDAAAIYSNA